MNFTRLAEKQIEAAIEAGELDDLEGAGKPLPPLPAGDAMEVFGYRMMAKVGAVPREVMLHREIAEQREALKALPADSPERERALAKLSETQMHLAMLLEQRRAGM